MALSPPKVKWFNGTDALVGGTTFPANTLEMTEWNVGVVDAGGYSHVDDPAIPDDPNYPGTFLIWNNRYDANDTNTPKAGTVDVSDMTNVTVTTLSLVRDVNGNIDSNLSYQPSGALGSTQNAIAGKEQGIVQVLFWDSTKNSGSGGWGSYDATNTTWQSNVWREIGGNDKSPVISSSGAKSLVKGLINTANLSTDKANYAKVKMRLYVKPNATAGKVEWITRVSYQYQG